MFRALLLMMMTSTLLLLLSEHVVEHVFKLSHHRLGEKEDDDEGRKKGGIGPGHCHREARASVTLTRSKQIGVNEDDQTTHRCMLEESSNDKGIPVIARAIHFPSRQLARPQPPKVIE
jgi:hypothetical protein